MTDPGGHTYPSPLAGYESARPLPDERAADGKSFVNPPADQLSPAYDAFVDPLDRGERGGFDIHIYYLQTNPAQARHARELWERIRREFPELRIYTFWDRPIGPHPVAMFEVNVFTPAQFGAIVPWLVVWRGPLSVLIHPNTVAPEPAAETAGMSELRDHTERAIWMGQPYPLNTAVFYRARTRGAVEGKKALMERGELLVGFLWEGVGFLLGYCW